MKFIRMMDISMEIGYLWCSSCERAYHSNDTRVKNGMEVCAYEDCDGDTILEAKDWGAVRNSRYPLFPEIPQTGQFYTIHDN